MAEMSHQQAAAQLMKAFLQPWYEAMANPPAAQQKVLKSIKKY